MNSQEKERGKNTSLNQHAKARGKGKGRKVISYSLRSDSKEEGNLLFP